MISRRQLLAAMASTPIVSMMGTGSAHALPNNDYKALVCVFLFGGNDGFNMLVPNDNAHYDEYVAARPDIAIPQSSLLPLSLNTGSALTLGLHPSMTDAQTLFESGKMVAIANSGVLIEPSTKEGLQDGTHAMPPFLFSHNSQQTEWQRGWSGSTTTLGWAGRLMDVLSSDTSEISPTFSLNGYAQLLNGTEHAANLINASSLPKVNAISNAQRRKSFDQVMSLSPHTAFGREFDRVKGESISIRDTLATAIDSIPEEDHFPDISLAQQLHTVARLIKSSDQLGHQKQIYFVGLGGFDTHANQLEDHAALMSALSQSLAAFNQSMEASGLGDKVTTMTMSDFGRRLASNGTGTDHGWASNHLVMGGALNGGQLYGQWPSLVLDGENDFNKGRMIPTTSVEQIGATIAKWMGVRSESAMAHIFPNLANFSLQDLGFLK
ncbi:DUF1501 domain-containing protein [Vibrio sp. D404a]|uniref:DUF1501 domain-containing protein n=1 Tax=unclassified Vibrio TaxID=2614977 RepID=UPI0025526FCC|nr:MULTISPECIES: DUF1501 domain-containing protein [unclassified Vibrio]MDK9736032.1 DUF1501 domain-containing protein [Vibrio sp. D404a]MDK9797802.1 DUF1501 domain-containing protein [Vibrio sp. D449a]